MSITIFYICLLIVQIVKLVKAIKRKDNNSWLTLFMTIILSMLFVIVFHAYYNIKMIHYIGWNLISYAIISIIAMTFYILMLIIGIVFKMVNAKKIKKDKVLKKSLYIRAIIWVLLFITAVFLEDLPYMIKGRNDAILEKKAKVEIIEILNKKYGEGDFEIVNVEEKNICYNCAWLAPFIYGYEFEISSKYLEDTFIISLTKDDFIVFDDNFLNEYYKEKENITDLKNYLKSYKIDELNETIHKDYKVDINFKNTFVNNFIDKDYGYIPSIEELASNVELHDPYFEIKENLTTKKELLNYLLKLTKYFIEDLDKSNISYSQENKYFRYKYDYSKLGVNDYNKNTGYVQAGEYKYSEELEHYVVENEDTLVIINVMGNMYRYDIDDVLKK